MRVLQKKKKNDAIQEKLFAIPSDVLSKNICVWNFALLQRVHQHYLVMVCFFCLTFLQLAFLTGPQ